MSEMIKSGRKVTTSVIDEVTRRVVMELLSFDIPTTARILQCSNRKIYNLIREGSLIARAGKPGARGVTITAASMLDYCNSIEVPVEIWQDLERANA